MERGLYVIWLHIDAAARVRVGALGELEFPPGLYAYVGSAQRNREARIKRHLRRDKPKRWHIDYLRPFGAVIAVTRCEGARSDECSLAARLAISLGARRAAERFGSSDCGCEGHLLHVPPALDSSEVWKRVNAATAGQTDHCRARRLLQSDA